MKTPSVEPVLRSRLLPRISFRVLLLLTAAAAVVASLARAADEGGALAAAIVIVVGFILASFAMFVAMFLICWAVSWFWYRPDSGSLRGSPFAEGQLPPQILPPREPKS